MSGWLCCRWTTFDLEIVTSVCWSAGAGSCSSLGAYYWDKEYWLFFREPEPASRYQHTRLTQIDCTSLCVRLVYSMYIQHICCILVALNGRVLFDLLKMHWKTYSRLGIFNLLCIWATFAKLPEARGQLCIQQL